MNQVLVVGRLIETPKFDEKSGNYLIKLLIAIPSTNQNIKIEYASFNFVLNKFMYEKIKELSKIDDVIGIKGHLTRLNRKASIVAEKVTFLSTSRKK